MQKLPKQHFDFVVKVLELEESVNIDNLLQSGRLGLALQSHKLVDAF